MKHSRRDRMTKEECDKERKEWKIAYELDNDQHTSEKKYLFALLEKHMEGWWD